MSWWHEPPLPVGTKLYTTPPAAQPAPVQEPITWLKTIETLGGFGKFVEAKPNEKGAKPVYLTPPAAQPAVPEGMVLVPYEPSVEMQEQGSTAAGYDLSQKRARYVYQSMIDMHVLREGAEPTDQWFRIQAGYTTPPAAQPAPVQSLPFGVGGGLVAIKTLLSRDPCVHATTAIEMIDAILKEHPAAQRQWVGLTDEEILEAAGIDGADTWLFETAYAIEAKLKEKNNG
jgi:hypothetical protein